MKLWQLINGALRFCANRRGRRKPMSDGDIVSSHRWAGACLGLLCYHVFIYFIVVHWPLRFLHWKEAPGDESHLTYLVLPLLGWVIQPFSISLAGLAVPLALVFAGHFVGKTQPIGLLKSAWLKTVCVAFCALMLLLLPLTLLAALCVEQ